MSERDKKDLAGISKVEVEPLTDADLDSVSGGSVDDGFEVANNATTGCPVSSNTANACC